MPTGTSATTPCSPTPPAAARSRCRPASEPWLEPQ
jgi:hypothetical protein